MLENTRDKLAYYQNLLEIVETPTIGTLIEQFEETIAWTKKNIASKLLVPSTDRDKMIRLLDDVLEARGLCRGIQTIINMLHPDGIRVILEDLQEDLKTEANDE